MVAIRSDHPPVTPLNPEVALFNSRRVRQARVGGETWFSLADVLLRLDHADAVPHLDRLVEQAGIPDRSAFFDSEGGPEPALRREEVLRLVALLDSHAARRVQAWIVERAIDAERLERRHGTDDAARDSYRRRGESRFWIDKRQGTRSARRDLAAEWSARGASSSDDFRRLTNELLEAVFGMDVAAYRARKHLPASANLRDHMSAAELTLVELAESLAAELARRLDAHGVEELAAATIEAGRIAAAARQALEARVGDVTNLEKVPDLALAAA